MREKFEEWALQEGLCLDKHSDSEYRKTLTRGAYNAYKLGSDIKEEKDVWVVYTNTDLEEGKGEQYPEYVCVLEATAERLAKGGYVMGSNSPIRKEKAIKIGTNWYYPNRLMYPSQDDKVKTERLNKRRKIKEKMRKAGITKAEMEYLGI